MQALQLEIREESFGTEELHGEARNDVDFLP